MQCKKIIERLNMQHLLRYAFATVLLLSCSVFIVFASDGDVKRAQERRDSSRDDDAAWHSVCLVSKLSGVMPIKSLDHMESAQRMFVGVHGRDDPQCFFVRLGDDGRPHYRNIETLEQDDYDHDYALIERIVPSSRGFKVIIDNFKDRNKKLLRTLGTRGEKLGSDSVLQGQSYAEDVVVDSEDRLVTVSELLKRCELPFDASQDVGSLMRMPQAVPENEGKKQPWFVVSNGSAVAFADGAGALIQKVDLQKKCKKYGIISRLLPLNAHSVVMAFSRHEHFSLGVINTDGVTGHSRHSKATCFFHTDHNFPYSGPRSQHRPLMARVDNAEIVVYDRSYPRCIRRVWVGDEWARNGRSSQIYDVAYEADFGKDHCTALAVCDNTLMIGASSGLYMCDMPVSDRKQ